MVRRNNGKNYVDLHVHSCYSDGSLTPEEIVEMAVQKGVGLLAIADHDTLEGNRGAVPLCEKAGIRLLPAVEIDTYQNGKNVHVLAYGFDPDNAEFTQFLRGIRFALDEGSIKLIEAMEADGKAVSLEEYLDYEYDPLRGGWNCLSYLLDKGLTETLEDGMAFYGQYGVSDRDRGYPSVRTACLRIHRAGGRAVLAHPGATFKKLDHAAFEATLTELLPLGLDGIECHYPEHSEETRRICLGICRENDLLITSGSDCHGTFGDAAVGDPGTTLDMVNLKEVIE